MRTDQGAGPAPYGNHERFADLEPHIDELLRFLSEAVVLLELVYDPTGRPVDYLILGANPAFEAVIAPRTEPSGGPRASALFGTCPPPGLASYAQIVAAQSSGTFEMTLGPRNHVVRVCAFYIAPARCAAILEDVTERRRLEQRLGHAQRLETIGQLAGDLAHDFNNLLTAILGYSELLLAAFDAGDSRRRDVEEIRKASETAAALNRQLLAYSRRERMPPGLVNLNAIVIEVEEILRRLLGPRGALLTELTSGLKVIRAEPGQIQQIILNFAVNARDAMPEGGTLTIRTGEVELPDPGHGRTGLPPGPYVTLTIQDTGVGIDKDLQPSIFEPFFTTKEKGTGLGLATVASIVGRAGGGVRVHSEPRQGTSFTVYLPALDQDSAGLRDRDVEPTAAGGRETILVVEDQSTVRDLTCKILEQNGYTVIEAHQIDAVLSLVRRRSESIDLVLMDIPVVGTDGRELMDSVQRERPDLKVLYLSGYPDTPDGAESGQGILHKPFTAGELLWQVRHALNDPPSDAENIECQPS